MAVGEHVLVTADRPELDRQARRVSAHLTTIQSAVSTSRAYIASIGACGDGESTI